MGLFDQIVGALDNPNQQANTNQLSGILGTVQSLAGSQGMNSATTQALMSVVGGHVRSALQQQRATAGSERTEAIVNQFSGTSPNAGAVQALFSPQQQQQVSQDAAQKTGVNAGTIQSMLPLLIPVILNLLQSGASNSTAQSSAPTPGNASSNSVLNAFLDSDGDGQVDVGDAMSLANRFLNQRR